ncbi:MAG: substrate-binding domain-containing protein [Lachnospiraceae bacterium]|nr:substrate-binding domain-containing protein [Lachnospiraceae bacterium]
MKQFKRVLCMLLVAAVVLSAGCGKQEISGAQESTRMPDGSVTSEEIVPSSGIVTDESLPPTEVDISGINQDNYPNVDGSTATLPLAQSLYTSVTGADMEEATQRIVHSKTTASYHKLIAGEADLLIVGEANDDTVQAAKDQGVPLLSAPIAIDAFVFMVNENNPVQSLTIEQIVDIYAGKITNWSEVGGANLPIVAFQRNLGAGSQTLMEEMVMQGTPMVEAPSMVASTMMGMLTAIASYNNMENAIGYSVFYYAGYMEQTPGLRFIQVEGQEPCAQTISDGSYPLISQKYTVIRYDEPKDSPARRLYDYLRSPQGQMLAQKDGYVPYTDPAEVIATTSPSGSLSIGEDEGLLLSLGNFNYVVIDKQFQVLGQVGSVLRNDLSGGLAQKSEIISLNEPLIFYTLPSVLGREVDELLPQIEDDPNVQVLTDYGKDWRAGLYHPQTGTWILEPTHLDVHDMGGGLYAATDVSKDDRSVTQITIIDSGGRELAVYPKGRVIDPKDMYGSPGYIILPDGIYQASGEPVLADSEAMDFQYALPSGYFVRENGENEYRNWPGKTLPLEEGSSFKRLVTTKTGRLEIWNHQIDGEVVSVLINADCQVVMDIHKFFEINKAKAQQLDLSKDRFSIQRYDNETGCYLLGCLTQEGTDCSLVVDQDFLILRDYENIPSDLVRRKQADALSVEDIWTGNTEVFHVSYTEAENIYKLGERIYYLQAFSYEGPEGVQGALYVNGESVMDQLVGFEKTEHGILCVRTFDPAQGPDMGIYTSSGCYVYDTGQVVEPREGCVIRYFDEEYYCYTEGEYAYMMDYQGNLYLRIPSV